MRTLEWYLDTAKTRNDIDSDRKLAQRLDLNPSQINFYRNKDMKPKTTILIKIAKLAGVSPDVALTDRALWLAESDEERNYWERLATLAQKAAVAGVSIGALLSMLAGAPAPATAGTNPAQTDKTSAESVYYGKRRRRRENPTDEERAAALALDRIAA